MHTLIPSHTDDAVAFLTERALAMADEHADAEYERRERAAHRVTFDDVLEQLAALPDAKKAELMDAYGRDSHFVWLLSTAFADSFEAAADLRVAQGD